MTDRDREGRRKSRVIKGIKMCVFVCFTGQEGEGWRRAL